MRNRRGPMQTRSFAPDPNLSEVRCPGCNKLLFRWGAIDAKIEIVCPRCLFPVVLRARTPLPVARPTFRK